MDPNRWRGVAADIERTATPRGRVGVGCYAIEGVRLHERALRAGCRVERAVVAQGLLRDPTGRLQHVLEGIKAAGGEWLPAPEAAVDALTGERSAGIVGLVALPASLEPGGLFAGAPRALVTVAVEVEDPGNVGALMRTSLAVGAAAFAAVGISDPFHPKAVRTSMGALFKLPVLRFSDVAGCLAALAANGVHTVGAVSVDGIPLPDYRRPPGRLALLVGSEAFGLPDTVAAGLDARVSIPQSAEVDSFSVNAAAAILLYSLRLAPGEPNP